MNGGTLDLNNLGLTVGAATAGNSGTILDGTAGNATLTFNVPTGVSASSSATIVDGTGTVTVVKSGAGTVMLSGVNNYSGGTTISAGTLGINADAALGASTGTLSWSANGTLAASNSLAIARPINVPTGIIGTIHTPGAEVDLNGPISGAGTLVAGIAGDAGTFTISNTASTFTGTLSIGSSSLVQLKNSGVLSSATILVGNGGTIDLAGQTYSGVLQIPSGGTFGGGTIANNMPTLTNSNLTQDAIINGTATTGGFNQTQSSFFQVRGPGNIQLNTFWQANSSNTASGGLIKLDNSTLTIGGGSVTPNNSNNQTVVFVGSFTSDSTHASDAFLPGGTVVLAKSSTATAGATRFILINDGTVVYGTSIGSITGGSYGSNVGQNNAVTINGQGVLDLNGSGSINSSVGILSVGTFANSPNTGTFSDIDNFGNGTILNNAANTTATLTFGVGNTNTNAASAGLVQTAFTGNIEDGLGTLALVKAGTGTAAFDTDNGENGGVLTNGTLSVNVSGNNGNTFSGGYYSTNGSTYVASNDALGVGTIGLNGGTFATFSTIAHAFANPVGLGGNTQVGDTTRTGNLTFNGPVFINANSTLTASSTFTFAGTVSGPASASLTKAGTSTMTLGGSNTYAGNTNVNAGTLAITNSGALNGTPVVNLASGGTLSVSAVAPYSTPGQLTVAGAGGVVVGAYNHSAGTISPGATNLGNFSAGTVTFSSGVALSGGSTPFIDLNGGTTSGSDEVIAGAEAAH